MNEVFDTGIVSDGGHKRSDDGEEYGGDDKGDYKGPPRHPRFGTV